MFRVKRPAPPPEGLTKGFNTEDVVLKLRDIFYSKCYLCESKRVASPEVEHFIPQSLDPLLEDNWDNLFYSCRRCNSIKSASQNKLLDCTKVDVFEAIILELPLRNSKPISVEVNKNYESEEASNTASLLLKCFNNENSGYQKITRAELRRRILYHCTNFLKYRELLLSDEAGEGEVAHAEGRLKRMVQPTFEFHAFWRRMFIEDEELIRSFSHFLKSS